jgi:hypothetical protein
MWILESVFRAWLLMSRWLHRIPRRFEGVVVRVGEREEQSVDVWGMEVRLGWRDLGIVCGPSTLTSPLAV